MSATRPQKLADTLVVILLGAALAIAQVLIGGTRLVFSLPAYAVIAAASILALATLRRPKPGANAACLFGSALFFGYVIARALLSPVPYVARTDLYIVLGALLVYGVTVTTFTDARARLALVGFLLVGAMVHTGIGAIQFRDGDDFMLLPFLARADYGRRASGFYVCPNHLAGFLEVIAIFGVSTVCWSRLPIWLKLFCAYATAVAYAGAVLTGSRGGYLSIGASLLVFAGLSIFVLRGTSGTLPWKIAGAGFLFAAFAGAAVYLSVRTSDFLTERAGNIADVSNVRVDLWRAAIEQWKLAPAFGTGSATYRYYGRKFRAPSMQLDPLEAHSDYVQLLSEYGAVGALGFAGFLAVHLRAGGRAFRRLGDKRVAVASRLLSNNLALNLGALGAVAAYLVHSAFDFNLHIPANALVLAFVFGVLANPGAWLAGTEGTPAPRRWIPRLAVALLGLVMLVQTARLWPAEYFAEKARVALRSGDAGAAIFFANKSVDYDQTNPEVFAYLGRARLGIGFETANPRAQTSLYLAGADALEAARALAPLEENYPLTLGMLYDLLGRYAEGEWMLDLALDLDPRGEAVQQYYQAHLARWRAAANRPRN